MATLTADAELCSQLQDLSISELHDLSITTPCPEAVRSLFEHYTTISSEETTAQGILKIFCYLFTNSFL